MLDDGATQMRMPDDEWPVVAAPDHVAAAAVTVNWGVWARTSAGDLRREDLGDETVLRLWRSRALAKTITLWHDRLVMPMSDELEIAPTRNPLDVPVGHKLKVRVVLHRRPVADAVVCYDGEVRGVTGRDGTINIRLRHDGLQILTASLHSPDPDGVLDEIVHETTLSFVKE